MENNLGKLTKNKQVKFQFGGKEYENSKRIDDD